MRQKAAILLTTLAALIFGAAAAQAKTFTTLYNFTGNSDGSVPEAGVIQDPSGNLFGTTYYGGDVSNCGPRLGCGVVYEVNTAGTETVLHSFTGYPSDGAYPAAPVARDKSGNLYGTTQEGGTGDCGGGSGCGTVFKIDTAGNETVLYSFTGKSDGCYPEQGLVVETSGTLIGTTWECGATGDGTIFKIDSAGNFTVLYGFDGLHGESPQLGHLTMDTSGNLYGVTTEGGAHKNGALYKLSKSGTLTVLHSFAGGKSDGCTPYGTVMRDTAGNLYGTTYGCGAKGEGTIWEVSKTGEETILHSFAGTTTDGCFPLAGVAQDSQGNLYGVTSQCGGKASDGALYELSAKGKLTLLLSFYWPNGADPIGEVLRTSNGTLFGTTCLGGSSGYYGTVWSYVP
jgi:uncharacterized repeat protein (TIGR03803 family)